MVNDAVNTMREAYDAAHQENGRLTLTDEELETDLLIPWSWVVDDTRTTLEVTSWDSTDHALASIASQMRLDLWATQPVRLEVLVESDSIAGVISSVCASLDRRVTIRVAHGQSSCTPVYNATCDYREWDRAVHVLAVTDMDPSGESIARSVEERLHRYAPESDITVQRLAITAEQVVASADIQAGGHKPNTKDPNLKRYTRDSKRRFARLGHPELADPVQSFETESMPVDELRSMLADAIDSFPRDVEEWNAELARENEARAELRTIARHRDELPWLLEHGGEIPLTTPAEGEDVDTDEGDEE
jgi:hypothetical protein